MTTIEKIAEIRKRCDAATDWNTYLEVTGAINSYNGICGCVKCKDIREQYDKWKADRKPQQPDALKVLNALEAAVKAFKELHERDCHRVANSIAKLALEQIGEMLK